MSLLNMLFGKRTENGGIQVLDCAGFAAGMAQGNAQLIDVRTREEFQQGHISKAKNINIQNAGLFAQEAGKLKKDQPVYVYCRSGARSRFATRKLRSMGFAQIYDLKGGYMAWCSYER